MDNVGQIIYLLCLNFQIFKMDIIIMLTQMAAKINTIMHVKFLTSGKYSLNDSSYYNYFIIHRTGCATLTMLDHIWYFQGPLEISSMCILYKSINKRKCQNVFLILSIFDRSISKLHSKLPGLNIKMILNISYLLLINSSSTL